MDHGILTAERLRALLRYDPETGIFTRLTGRPKARAGTKAGTVNGGGHLVIKVDGKQYRAHRLAWLYVYGEWPTFCIDHINGIKTDNRLVNLRDVPAAINNQNLHAARKDNSCGIMGVRRRGKKWEAKIKLNGHQMVVGLYDTPEDAHEAYLEAKRVLHKGCAI